MKNSLRAISIVVIFSLLLIMTACGGDEGDKNPQTDETELSSELLENEENKSYEQSNDGQKLEKSEAVDEIQEAENVEVELGNSDENNEDVSPTYNSTYKLFYGEWEITKVVGYDYHLGKSFPEADEMIGARISYSKTEIETIDTRVDKLDYSYTINPNISDLCYFNNTLTNKELGIKGEYYVFVHVETYIPGVNLGISFVGDEFFIIDDKTLILVKNNVFYLAERISYIDDAEEIDYSHW